MIVSVERKKERKYLSKSVSIMFYTARVPMFNYYSNVPEILLSNYLRGSPFIVIPATPTEICNLNTIIIQNKPGYLCSITKAAFKE